jgi:2-dehydro-3-deoxygluconokinase
MRSVPPPRPDGFDVVCVGETMAMVTSANGQPLATRPPLAMEIGGAESNVACGLAALGHRVAWVSRLGADPFGDRILAELCAREVDLAGVEVDPAGRTGVYFKDPGPSGTAVYYYRNGSAASAMGPATVRGPAVAGARIVHVSGITAALSPGCALLLEALLVERAAGGALVSFDVNYRPKLWPPAAAAPVLLRLARAADLVFVGLDEAVTLWPVHDARGVRELMPGVPLLVIKDAGRGATFFGAAEGEVEVPAPAVDVVEPVGAGDAFAAGYLSALLGGRDAVTRLRTGHLMAAAALRSVGDLGEVPPREALERQLALDEAAWAALAIPGSGHRNDAGDDVEGHRDVAPGGVGVRADGVGAGDQLPGGVGGERR